MDSGKPYTDLEVTDDYIIREFDENIDPIEMLWHRDLEDRTIEAIGETNWQIQLDNCLPTSIKERIFIPKHEWHRVIKGTGTLKLKIKKMTSVASSFGDAILCSYIQVLKINIKWQRN